VETPARRQYLDLKAQHPDALLLYRMGDFYEMFDDDAVVAARELRITLTSREFGKGQRVPMAGVPHHALQSYLRRLIGKGFRVAICEQLSEPGHGLVDRAVVRVVSPGTVAEPGLLVGNENNYLAAVCSSDEVLGLAYVDVTTGEFAVTEFSGAEAAGDLAAELHRIRPAECLHPGEQPPLEAFGHCTPLDPAQFDALGGREILCRHFGVRSLEGFGCAAFPQAVGAAGAIIRYLERTNPALLALLANLRTYSPAEFLVLDPGTRRNLELTRGARSGTHEHSLLGVIDRTRTPMGGRLLRQMLGQPLRDLRRLDERLDAIEELVRDDLHRRVVSRVFRSLGDLERVIGRVKQSAATPRDLRNLRDGLSRLPEVADPLRDRHAALLREIFGQLDTCGDVVALIGTALADDESTVIRPGYSRELDLLTELLHSSRAWMVEYEQSERQRTGIRSLKVGFNKVFGYYLEVTRSNLAQVPPDYVRKQTLSNGERFITSAFKDMEARVLSAETRVQELEQELFDELLAQVGACSARLLSAARAIAQLDVIAAWAELASERGYVRPELVAEGPLVFEGARHPVVEARLGAQEFVPNDCALGGEHGSVQIVTGPNMAGKSTYLRQVALVTLLAQSGAFVPARRARVPLVDRIFSRIGAQDDLAAGASTFLVEMAETANILRHATPRSLVILDEVGRGTSTYDGLAIAQAVVEELHDRVGARTLFATHYHELTALEAELPNVRNFHASAREEDDHLVFLYQMRPGPSDRSYGLQVARLAGLPATVVQRAALLLAALEQARCGETADVVAEPASEYVTIASEAGPSGALVSLALAGELLAVDLAGTTPIEALNLLHRLQRSARDLVNAPQARLRASDTGRSD
jgi:DNA mismatch repair protein MutS